MRRRAKLAALVMSLVMATLVVITVTRAGASGVTLSVTTAGHDVGNCQISACATVGYALAQGTSGDTINVGPGTFVEQTLVLSYPVTINGAGSSATTIDVSQHNPICATYIAVAISITTTNNPCTYPGPTAGSYTFNGMTIEGNPGGIASPSITPFLVFAQNLPANTSLSFTNDHLLTNATVDPALGTDESIGVYNLGSGPTDSITVAHDTLSGFFHATFMEGFPGTLNASDSTYENLSLLNPGPYAPQGVYLLADAAGPMNGTYSISENAFENYGGFGVRAKSGFFSPNQTGDLENVSVVGNRFDLGSVPGSPIGSAAVGLVGAPNGGDTMKNVTATSNWITATGVGAIDAQVTGYAAGDTFSGIAFPGNDLLGGSSTTGVDNQVPITVDGTANYWGDPGGPGAPGATTVTTGNGGTVTTNPAALQSVFSPSGVTAGNSTTTQAHVTWVPPTSAGHVPVMTYSIVTIDLTTGTTGSVVSVPGTATSVTVPGLSPGDRYSFSVTANNTLTVTAPGVSNVIGGLDGKGYWLDASDGGIFTFGSAQFYGSMGGTRLNQPMVGMAATPTGRGYWLAAADGGVFSFGDARFYGSKGDTHLNQPVVGIASTATGEGYWLVAKDGGIFSFGDARFYGSTGSSSLGAPVVGMAATPTGRGYWLAASDGGVFRFGDAVFLGSPASQPLNRPIVGIDASPVGHGYWLAAADGGVFSFGDARFFGSMGGRSLNQPVVGMATNPSGSGYWLAAADGGVFSFGGTQFWGSMGGTTLNQPVVGMAAH